MSPVSKSTEGGDSSLFTTRRFSELDLPESLSQAVDDLGFEFLTQVQGRVLPMSLSGSDVVVQAQTGSGKTAAFLLTILKLLIEKPRSGPDGAPRALIVAPTRELAVQIERDCADFAKHTGLNHMVVFGGLDYKKQRDQLRAGVDILIGTPGRLIDYLKQGAYTLGYVDAVCVDECDRLFDMGFAPDLMYLMRFCPKSTERQSMMYTATLSYRVSSLGARYMNHPEEVVVRADALTPTSISQVLYHVGSREKLSLLLGVLNHEGVNRTMVFVNTRHGARNLVDALRHNGYEARGLTGNVEQRRRLKVLDDFKSGDLPILVATDVASRGLHIEGVTHVVNYDLPQDPEDYVHRIGRTARAGADGTAISLACEDYVYSLAAIEDFVKFRIPAAAPTDDLFVEVKRPPRRRPRYEGDNRGRGGNRGHRDRGRNPHQSQSGDGEPKAERSTRGNSSSSSEAPSDGAAPKRRRRRRRGGGSGGDRSGS